MILVASISYGVRFDIRASSNGWTGTVYIRANGSIEPADAPIITYDNVTYTLVGNITSSGDGIVVERDNILIDGSGFTVQGTGEYPYSGIVFSNRVNVTILNLNIQKFCYGITLNNSSNNSISGSNITNNRKCGIRLSGSHNRIFGNYVTNDGIGISVSGSNNSIYGNKVGDNIMFGIQLSGSNNKISENHMKKNQVYSVYFSGSNNSICRNNIANSGVGIIFSGLNNNIHRNNISNVLDGIDLSGSHNSIHGNNITNADEYGISIVSSSDNYIFGNNIINSTYGVVLWNSSSNTISENNVINIRVDGIFLDYFSNYNSIRGNSIINSGYDGIYLMDSSFNIIYENNILKSLKHGIYLNFYRGSSSNNIFFHNNLIDNAVQAGNEDYINVGNIWDSGCPSGGNYWSDYEGVDADGDGIGDTPYTIDDNNIDHYPLMGPFNSFNISVGYSVDVVSNSTIEDFKYFESNNTIVMYVSNRTANQIAGFCRLTIPHNVMSPPYIVKVNGTTIEYQTVYENHTEGISIIYFTYEHSKLKITIIPEIPSAMILTLSMLTTLIATILLKRRRKPKRRSLS